MKYYIITESWIFKEVKLIKSEHKFGQGYRIFIEIKETKSKRWVRASQVKSIREVTDFISATLDTLKEDLGD